MRTGPPNPGPSRAAARAGVPAKMRTRENVHLTILRQRILIRRQNSPVKCSRENVHQPRICECAPDSLHFAHALHFAHDAVLKPSSHHHAAVNCCLAVDWSSSARSLCRSATVSSSCSPFDFRLAQINYMHTVLLNNSAIAHDRRELLFLVSSLRFSLMINFCVLPSTRVLSAHAGNKKITSGFPTSIK